MTRRPLHHAIHERTTGKPVVAPKVFNKHHKNAPIDAIYIGRGSPWGNPFVIGVHGNRDQVIQQYHALVHSDPANLATIKRELKGKHLVCFCAPKPCHGDVLLRIANEE